MGDDIRFNMTFLKGQNELILKAKSIPHYSLLAKRILERNSFVMATVSGERQIGKSMYMMLVLYDLFRNWDVVFEHIFYTIDDLVDYLIKARETGLRDVAIGVDDAGIYFGANQWSINREGVVLISNVFDTIGTVSKGAIFTLPNSGNLIKNIRVSEAIVDIRIRQGRGQYDRQAYAYIHRKTPKDQDMVTKEFIENYDVRIPEVVYERYAKLRDSYSADTLQKMKDYMEGESEGVFKDGRGKKFTTIEVPD